MKVLILYVLRAFLVILYAPIKLLPSKKNKVVFLSRQTNGASLDYRLVQEYLKSRDEGIRIVNICRRYEKGLTEYVVFLINIVRSLYHLSTSGVCVIDGYWPAVSMLRHKKTLTVIEIWHAMGKIKESGYKALGKRSGRNPRVAKAMRMHRNYDVVVAGAKAWNKFYCESFDISEDVLLNCGLPRIDYLLKTKEENRRKVLSLYPELENKTVLLYAPTFRKGWDAEWEDLEKCLDFNRYALIVKAHPNQKLTLTPNCLTCDEFSSAELLSVCDYLITDYSAIAVEGALIDVKTFYYVYDYEEYLENNGLNIDLFKEMPDCVFKDAKALANALEKEYPISSLEHYKAKYLPENLGTSTKTIGDLIINSLGKKNEFHQKNN
ncbi:MAG: CDP-glycerol glycerophosphotransferase family protein [Eubacterium sp.]|nr:CDP-glycerol glycerophosphotransferase family protein [Eubacterium sp.]